MARPRFTVTVILVLTMSAAAADWPQFQGPNRNGIAPEGKVTRAWPEGGPPLLWSANLGPGFAGPAIRDGNVYVLDRIPDTQDVLRCLDLADGQELWRFAYDAPGKLSENGSRTTPTVDDKYVFIIGPFGHFHCVDKATRKPIWQKHLLEDYESKLPNWGVAQSPLLYKDAVIVAPLGKKIGVMAFEKATGRELWRSGPIAVMAYSSPLMATVDGVEQVVMGGNNRTGGVDVTSGELLWTYSAWRCGIPIPSPTPIGDGRFFITGGYDAGSAMFKVQRQQGKFTVQELFRVKELGSQIHNALLHQGHLYLGCNTNSKQDGLVCMDLEGNVKWKTGRSPHFERGNYILADGVLVIMDGRTGVLRLVEPDPAGYKELAQAQVLSRRPIWAPMAFSDGKLIVRDQRQMKCLDLRPPKPTSAPAAP